MPLLPPYSGTAPDVSVVIPCLNEADNVRLYESELLDALAAQGFGSEIVFSDGGSSDGTPALLSDLSSRHPGVRVLSPGAPSSFAGSIARALPLCRGRYICLMEADLSFSPLDVARLLAAARDGDRDCVCGSPFLGTFEGMPLRRLALTYSANLLLRLRFGMSVTSYTQIFKLFRAGALRGLDFESEGFTLDAELTAKCIARGMKIAEVPVTMKARTLGSSKLRTAAETVSCLKLILRGAGSAPAGEAA